MEFIGRMLERIAPGIFVILWSTGFIGAKLGLPYAEPFTFLTLRMAIVVVILVPVVWLFVAKRAELDAFLHSMVTGILVHAIYLGGVFWAISHGMSAGISALIVALQPLVTVYVARALLGEVVNTRQMTGFVAALAGVVLVISPKIFGGTSIGGITASNLAAVFASVIAISLGSVYQKKFASGLDIRFATLGQYVGALLPLTLFSFLFETREIIWSGEFIFALGWLIIVLSIGAVSLLMFLIRRDSAASTANLFYLVPVSTAIIAWFLFEETLQPVQFIGMAIVIAAVAYGTRKGTRRPRPA